VGKGDKACGEEKLIECPNNQIKGQRGRNATQPSMSGIY